MLNMNQHFITKVLRSLVVFQFLIASFTDFYQILIHCFTTTQLRILGLLALSLVTFNSKLSPFHACIKLSLNIYDLLATIQEALINPIYLITSCLYT